jgi:membrane-bound ClpP family serine protease
MTICNLRVFLEIFAPMLGFFAAASWMTSAWFGRFTLVNRLVKSTMVSQSRWNAYAAIFASLSAFVQVSTAFVPVCRAFR